MAKDECGCGSQKGDSGEQSCAGCRGDEVFPYWCSSCNRAVADKRCPYCGLKAQKRNKSVPHTVPQGAETEKNFDSEYLPPLPLVKT
jgi:hypothetical protein